MNIYQQELLRRVQPLGCTGNYDGESGKLKVQYEGVLLCKQDENGFLTYDSRAFTPAMCDKLEEVKEQAAAIREYTDIYENAPAMNIESLKGYRRFAEYGDTVLGGKYSEKFGFEFATWKQDKDRSYVVHGDYTTDYKYAKKSFVCRSGLVNEIQMYDQKEAADIYAAIGYIRNHCGDLTYEQDERLKILQEKLTCGYPDIEESSPSFESDEEMQMNM